MFAMVAIFLIALFVGGFLLNIAIRILNVCMVPIRIAWFFLSMAFKVAGCILSAIWRVVKWLHEKYCLWFDRHFEYRTHGNGAFNLSNL